jgi:O-methyltransferase
LTGRGVLWPQAKSTLRRYGMLDERIVFVPGYFNESLAAAPSRAFALIHIDADAYDSVRQP